MLELQNVMKLYETKGGTVCALNGISLTFPNTGLVFIPGKSGCGKTTLISLFNRLYDISNGQILFDGINIQEFNLKSLRDKIDKLKNMM